VSVANERSACERQRASYIGEVERGSDKMYILKAGFPAFNKKEIDKK